MPQQNTSASSSIKSKSNKKPKRKIMIVGCGLAGLCIALCLKRISMKKDLNLEISLFDSEDPRQSAKESSPSHILWKWAVDVLTELGLSDRLSKIMKPITKYRSIDTETNQILVEYPPDLNTSASPNSDVIIDDSNLEMGKPDEIEEPPMYAVRHQDLLRVFALALSGLIDEELVSSSLSKTSTEANNSDSVFESIQGISADLARQDWYHAQNLNDHLPEIHSGYELQSFVISSTTGIVTVEFTNGHTEVVDMLIGADGANSKVRNLIYNDRCPPQHAGAACFSGILRLHLPPVDMPTELENGVLIPDLTREELLQYCPDGNTAIYSGKGYSFGTFSLGNGMLAWNLVIPQSEPKEHVRNYILEKQREKISRVMAKNPRRSFIPSADFAAAVAKSLESSEIPSSASTTSTPSPSMNTPHSSPNKKLLMDEFTQDKISSNGTPDLSESVVSPDSVDISELNISSAQNSPISSDEKDEVTIELEKQGAEDIKISRVSDETLDHANSPAMKFHENKKQQREPLISDSPMYQVVEIANTMPSFATLEELKNASISGRDVRDLALRLVQNMKFPSFALAMMARSEPAWMEAHDSLDLSEEPPTSYTCPDFHPGRVMIIGDAAHPIAINAQGSVGAGLAITDAAYLAKLIGKYLDPIFKEDDEHAFTCIASDFIQERLTKCNAIMKEARSEGGWDRTQNTIARSLMRLTSKYVPSTWKATSYESMLVRGAIPFEENLSNLYPVFD